MKNMWRRTAVRLMAGGALALLVACGGGGGGNAAPAPSPTPQGTGLVPAAPALGASLLSDASTLRPARDQSVWTYRQRTQRFSARSSGVRSCLLPLARRSARRRP